MASVLVMTQGCQNSKTSVDRTTGSNRSPYYYNDYHYDETCSNETLAQGVWCSIFVSSVQNVYNLCLIYLSKCLNSFK